MNFFILQVHFTLTLNTRLFNYQLSKAYSKFRSKGRWLKETDMGYEDNCLESNGIMIEYHCNSKKKKIRLIVCPSMVIDDNNLRGAWKSSSDNISLLLDTLDSMIASYFDSEYELKNFKLARIDFAVDIDVGSKEMVSDYIKVLRNIGRVKCFSPMNQWNYDDEKKDGVFGLDGNTNGIKFRVYALKNDKKVIRAETRLAKKSIIRAYCDEKNTTKLIHYMAKNSEKILMNTFLYIIPTGHYYKKGEAERLIRERVSDIRLMRKMFRFLDLIPKKRSLLLAQKALKDRNIRDVMAKFEEIEVSPVTISKRHGVSKLKSLYSYLEE